MGLNNADGRKTFGGAGPKQTPGGLDEQMGEDEYDGEEWDEEWGEESFEEEDEYAQDAPMPTPTPTPTKDK